ncbi:PH domain-containing protein [Sporosarcina limicola]|uniref:Membrane protein n=1 Tax=Sporosarcina limicola TaxID=34101 RepID=A0A927R5H6_9BACL|nr:PH domain-containing protein [Sporosarcina limicola]MBE1553919.1 putative membrane protein [Sporosarcina limicola]
MIQLKRYNPLTMLLDLWGLAKNAFFLVIFLFVLKSGSESTFIKYGRIAFYLFVGITVSSIILKWFTRKYKVDSSSFYMYKGLFNKFEQTVPFTKIHNVQRRTTLFHRIFGGTSITFETGTDTAVKFDVISRKEANRIEIHVKRMTLDKATTDQADSDEMGQPHTDEKIVKLDSARTIHFKPTRKDVLKASFTSLSFLILIPLVTSFYSKINDIVNVEDKAEGFLASIMNSWWVITILVVILIIASITFGIVRAFLKYGKYEISSDHERIYITKGVVDESAFTIEKDKVQAIEITQSLMKRLLGLAEIKLISAGSLGEDALDTNSLYPFLPVGRAYEMISEILPSYEVTQTMERLPKKSLWIRLLKPSWIWIIATAALLYFKPPIINHTHSWWILSAGLLIFIIVSRFLDYMNTRYILNGKFMQFKTGSLQTELFVSKREKVIEVKVTRNKFQQLLGLASIGTINRAKPVHHTGIKDVPVELADSFYTWYAGRTKEIKIE